MTKVVISYQRIILRKLVLTAKNVQVGIAPPPERNSNILLNCAGVWYTVTSIIR